MRATGNKIFLVQEEYKSDSGIIAPLKKQGYDVFKVAAVGPGEWNVFTGKLIEPSVKVGDRVIADVALAPSITIYKGITKTTYRVVAEKDIQMVLDEDDKITA